MGHRSEEQMIAIIRAVAHRQQAEKEDRAARGRADLALYAAFGAPLGSRLDARRIWIKCATGTTRN